MKFAADAIALLTDGEFSPSTIHLLALERLKQRPDWIEADEAQRLVGEILSEYVMTPSPTAAGPQRYTRHRHEGETA